MVPIQSLLAYYKGTCSYNTSKAAMLAISYNCDLSKHVDEHVHWMCTCNYSLQQSPTILHSSRPSLPSTQAAPPGVSVWQLGNGSLPPPASGAPVKPHLQIHGLCSFHCRVQISPTGKSKDTSLQYQTRMHKSTFPLSEISSTGSQGKMVARQNTKTPYACSFLNTHDVLRHT